MPHFEKYQIRWREGSRISSIICIYDTLVSHLLVTYCGDFNVYDETSLWDWSYGHTCSKNNCHWYFRSRFRESQVMITRGLSRDRSRLTCPKNGSSIQPPFCHDMQLIETYVGSEVDPVKQYFTEGKTIFSWYFRVTVDGFLLRVSK